MFPKFKFTVRVYVLEDLLGTPFYVGITTKPLSKRIIAHKSESKLNPLRSKNCKIIECEYNFAIRELEKIECMAYRSADAISNNSNKETEWIKHFESQGISLNNIVKSKGSYNRVNCTIPKRQYTDKQLAWRAQYGV